MDFHHEGFGESWDLGDSISEDLISYPIRQWLHCELRKQGINPNYWRRRGAGLTASAIGGFIGSIMGGPMGILLGLMGYATAMTATYSDEEEETAQENLEEALILTACGVATEALKRHVSRSTWESIYDEVQATVSRHKSMDPSPERTVDLIYDAIARVNANAASQWHSVLQVTRREADV